MGARRYFQKRERNSLEPLDLFGESRKTEDGALLSADAAKESNQQTEL